jgi:hypothetical protein
MVPGGDTRGWARRRRRPTGLSGASKNGSRSCERGFCRVCRSVTEDRRRTGACSGGAVMHPTDRMLGGRPPRVDRDALEAASAVETLGGQRLLTDAGVGSSAIASRPGKGYANASFLHLRSESRLLESCAGRTLYLDGSVRVRPAGVFDRGERHESPWFSSASWRAYSERETKGTRGQQGCVIASLLACRHETREGRRKVMVGALNPYSARSVGSFL